MGCQCREVMAIVLLLALLLAGFDLLAGKTFARTNIAAIVDRNTRYDVPYFGDNNGTAYALAIDSWKGTNWMGNLGIGGGSRAAIVDHTTTNETLLRPNIMAGKIIDNSPSSISLYDLPGRQFPQIFNEYPLECGTIYAKLLGLEAPGGHVLNMAVRALGAEYDHPCRG